MINLGLTELNFLHSSLNKEYTKFSQESKLKFGKGFDDSSLTLEDKREEFNEKIKQLQHKFKGMKII